MTKLLSAEEIFITEDLPRALVDLHLWGGAVWVRALTLGEQDNIRQMATGQAKMVGNAKGEVQITDGGTKMEHVRSLTVVTASIREDGTPLFTISQADALERKSAAMVDKLFFEIMRLTQMTDEEVKELEGESDAVPSGASSSD